MKSSTQELISRGYAETDEEKPFFHLPLQEKLSLLKSNIPTERTIAARVLKNERNEEDEVIKKLIEALKKEKKLYPKIEICQTLISFGEKSVKPLIAVLGKIGNNQHKTVPAKKFGKDNYLLLRDIAARTLAHIGTPALSDLLCTLQTEDTSQLSEVIDVIGYICFYHQVDTNVVLTALQNCFAKHTDNDLIRWKTYRAMSGLPESKSFLLEWQQKETSEGIQNEIARSLRLMDNNKSY